jgi:prostaglandin-H2 D-isomerase / glutathione transferase
MAMARYAAKLAGLYPDDPIQALFCDEVMDTLNELMTKAPRSKDPDEFKKLRQEYQITTMTMIATFVENIIQTNGNGKSVCTEPSVADLVVMGGVEMVSSGMFDHVDANFFDAYPGMKECCTTISNHPGVKAYYDSKKEE